MGISFRPLFTAFHRYRGLTVTGRIAALESTSPHFRASRFRARRPNKLAGASKRLRFFHAGAVAGEPRLAISWIFLGSSGKCVIFPSSWGKENGGILADQSSPRRGKPGGGGESPAVASGIF
jgi:hypothetical protein